MWKIQPVFQRCCSKGFALADVRGCLSAVDAGDKLQDIETGGTCGSDGLSNSGEMCESDMASGVANQN